MNLVNDLFFNNLYLLRFFYKLQDLFFIQIEMK